MKYKHRILIPILLVAAVLGFLAHGGRFPLSLVDVCADAPQRTTQTPATAQPDQVCLTWSSDPKTSQTIQWRTAPAVTEGEVQFRLKDAPESTATSVKAESVVLEDALITNDPSNRRFTALLTGLMPGTSYSYRVGNPEGNLWTEWAEFTTAPEGTPAFSFVYMGDPQIGFPDWGRLLRQSLEKHPETAFYVLAGDLVNRGNDRDDWDALFHAATGVLDRRPVVPTIGNHEYSRDKDPRLYRQIFTLPLNGPDTVPAEHAYSFQYSNALFVVLDSNQSPEAQRPWLEKQLAQTEALWKFAVYHHPAYSSAPNRDNEDVRTYWGDLFDRYHLDLALQGHDHAYMRTYPIKDEKIVGSPAEGTIYAVSVSGTKFYEQAKSEYTAVGFTDTQTYQLINIETEGVNRLTYRAYDIDGNVRDEVVITK